MAWNIEPTRQGEGRRHLLLFLVLGILMAIVAASNFADGENLVGVRKLTLAFLFILLAIKGPRLRSTRAVGARLLVIGVVLIYLALHIVPLIR